MKRLLSILILLFAFLVPGRSQVIIIRDGAFTGRLSQIRGTVVDSLSNESIPYASVYVIPAKDTTITNFTLSDTSGVFKLDEVPYGNYSFHVEMLGYKPWIVNRYFRDFRVDLGTIKMQPDEEFLSAAVITDVGNPIVIKQDTVEFNASSYRVGSNAMLKDLLSRMPGMEITDEGKVKFNGESIDKLTVGGRTFFFGDQSTALNNLPASIVDKVRVIDRESESTRSTGLQTGQREKVLDVGLKKEYEKGWFGNVALKGGSTLVPKDDDPMKDNRGFLFNANGLASAYSDKDQLTLIANGDNVSDMSGTFVIFGLDGLNISGLGGGITTSAQAGANLNTSRIKDVETTVGANYRFSGNDSGNRTSRTTFEQSGDILTESESSSHSSGNAVSADLEMRKEKGRVRFFTDASVGYGVTNSSSSGTNSTSMDGTALNDGTSDKTGTSGELSASVNSSVTIREIGGNAQRSLRFTAGGSIGSGNGNSTESTILNTVAGQDIRALSYRESSNGLSANGQVTYNEPLGEKWLLSATAGLTFNHNYSQRDASDASGHNDYYSSESDNLAMRQQYGLTAQYKWSDKTWLTFGASVNGTLNETESKSYGISTVTGKDDWNWYVSPDVRFQTSSGMNRFMISASGSSGVPSQSLMLPVPNISNPSSISLGNIYLKPNGRTFITGNWSRNDRAKFSTFMVFLMTSLQTNPVTYARWYDTSGIMYSVPVNTKRPGASVNFSVNWTTPLDEAKNWSLTVGAGGGYSSNGSYQANGMLPGIDKDNFDYTSFMDSFWGDKSGDLFYNGKSGFSESVTRTISPSASASVRYNQDHYSFNVSANARGNIARYSLNPAANMNTLDASLRANGSYTTKNEFEFQSDISYTHRFGYAKGYDLPEWMWNAEVSKNIGAFNLSFKVHDILNQTRTIQHTVTANYMEDSWSLALGRYFLFGVKWNFGKMNASHDRNATRAAINMSF
ncbi:MAG: TonB-dependent receptor [Bacteroidales bacterium]|nr:TonB-dependent receptor [Bacteroidales bacterium]